MMEQEELLASARRDYESLTKEMSKIQVTDYEHIMDYGKRHKILVLKLTKVNSCSVLINPGRE